MPNDHSSRIACIHVGFHKSASTWLQKKGFYLHPDLVLVNQIGSPAKSFLHEELIYKDDFSFNIKEAKEYFSSLLRQPEYQQKCLLLSEENLSGHIYTGWNAKRNLERVFKTFSGVKIFIIIRRQRDYIMSSYKNYIAVGGALNWERWIGDKELYPVEHIFNKLLYDRYIHSCMDQFGKGNVLVLPYELMIEEGHLYFMNRLYDFLGVNQVDSFNDSDSLNRRVNSGMSSAMLPVARTLNGIFGGSKKTQRRIIKVADAAIVRHFPRGLLRSRLNSIAALDDNFRESNRRTSNMIGIDLEKYGYAV